MSDSGSEWGSVAIGAAVTGAVGLVLAFIRALFTRNVGAADKAQEEMRADVKNILLELRSMHDEQTRQRADITAINKELARLDGSCRANHDRLDALVAPAPRGRK